MMSAAVFLFPPLAHSATLVIDGVNRLATSASDILIWESLYFSDFPDVVDKPYPFRYQSTKYSENSPSYLRKSPFIRFS